MSKDSLAEFEMASKTAYFALKTAREMGMADREAQQMASLIGPYYVAEMQASQNLILMALAKSIIELTEAVKGSDSK